MRPDDVIVTGAPRSGTSLVAGLFVAVGHRPGARMIPPTASNPAGFHEDQDVNAANDEVLDDVADEPWGTAAVPPRHLRWLGAFARPVGPRAGKGLDLAALVPDSPFVLKDPRFTYALPAWRAVLPAVRVVVVVRHPSEVVASVASMAQREPPTFAHFAPVADHVLAMWEAMYRSVLCWADEETVFVRHEDVTGGSGRARLGGATGTVLTGGVRPELHREKVRSPLPRSVADLLDHLDRRCRPPARSPGSRS